MDIAALATGLSQMKTANAVSMSMLKKSFDVVEGQSAQLIQMMNQNKQMMERSVTPHLGGNIDISG